jgi:DNA-binding transcriptional regulator YhcF (GntR family)
VTAPYRKIVDDLRSRIEKGELAPGDRVPSTRQIAAEWQVAIATATKALAALGQEGLVHAVPRKGTVVANALPPRRVAVPRRDTDRLLTRDRVVRAAIGLADEHGFATLSMRGIAAELQVATMSLYRHVRSREELALLMADTVFGDYQLPAVPPPTWCAQLELSARLQWAAYRRHPWLPRVISLTRPQPTPNLVPYLEWALRALEGHGQDVPTMLYAHITLFGYVRGTAVNLESEAEAELDTGLSADQWMDANDAAFGAIFAASPCPTFVRLVEGRDFPFDLDDLFEFGLQRLLDGFALLFR